MNTIKKLLLIINILIPIAFMISMYTVFDQDNNLAGILALVLTILWLTVVSFANGYFFKKFKLYIFPIPIVIVVTLTFLALLVVAIMTGARVTIDLLWSSLIFLAFITAFYIISMFFSFLGKKSVKK